MRARCFPLTCLLVVLPASPAAAKTLRVHPGGSIQAAVDDARPGDTVLVLPGVYHEAGRPCPYRPDETCAVVIERDNIKLVGLSSDQGDVVLEATEGQHDGIGAAKPGASGATCFEAPAERLRGVQIRGLTVRGFADDGIFLYCADDWEIRDVAAHDNAEYGLFPSHCGPGRITGSVATGSNDTGIYVGQSHDVRIDHNLVTDNVAGFEVENSSRVRLDHNVAVGNTAGVLVFSLPGLHVKETRDNTVEHNLVLANNRPNTCLDPDDAVCSVLSGMGILVQAADGTLVRHNVVLGNGSLGIGVADFCVSNALDPEICGALDIDPSSDDTRVTQNVALGNGEAPDPSLPQQFAVDLGWDTTGTGNCWENNVSQSQFPAPLPACD